MDVETFGSKDSEYSAQLTNIENAKPDVVIVCSYYQEGARILKKMREMGMNQPVLGDNGFVSPELGKMAGAAADNVYVSSMWSAARDTAATKTFVENYTKSTGMHLTSLPPPLMTACTWRWMRYSGPVP